MFNVGRAVSAPHKHLKSQYRKHYLLSSSPCWESYFANNTFARKVLGIIVMTYADLSLQDHERNKLNRPNNGRTTPLISGDEVIGYLLHNQMILTPVAIDAHGRLGPMT
jgi:hypothetical protein